MSNVSKRVLYVPVSSAESLFILFSPIKNDVSDFLKDYYFIIGFDFNFNGLNET